MGRGGSTASTAAREWEVQQPRLSLGGEKAEKRAGWDPAGTCWGCGIPGPAGSQQAAGWLAWASLQSPRGGGWLAPPGWEKQLGRERPALFWKPGPGPGFVHHWGILTQALGPAARDNPA